MIIPVKCFTCGEIADKYRYYLEQVKSKKMKRRVYKGETVLYLTR